jgi:fumarate hydratase class II
MFAQALVETKDIKIIDKDIDRRVLMSLSACRIAFQWCCITLYSLCLINRFKRLELVLQNSVKEKLIPSLQLLRNSLDEKAQLWANIVKIGRTHLQDATPLTLGQEFSGYVGLLDDGSDWLEKCLEKVYRLSLGGTAVGTGINAPPDFDRDVAAEIANLTKLPFITAPNKFTVQGSHDALVFLSGGLKTIASSLYKIANDIRLLSCGPRCGLGELQLPENEPGSSIMPGKVNPTQCEALSMIAVQVMANDLAVTMGGAGGHLEMNVYKPLLIHNLMQSIRLLTDGCANFCQFLVKGMTANQKQIETFLNQSLMLDCIKSRDWLPKGCLRRSLCPRKGFNPESGSLATRIHRGRGF